MTTKEIKRFSASSKPDTSETDRLTYVESCMSILYKLSNRCQDKYNVPLYGLQEDVVVGYESSWAGISKNADLK
jgi:hypothetical protein